MNVQRYDSRREDELIRLMKAQDLAATEELLRRHERFITRVCRASSDWWSQHDVEDAVTDVMMAVFQHGHSFRGASGGEFRRWVVVIAGRASQRSNNNRRRLRPVDPSDVPSRAVELPTTAVETRDALAECLAQLSGDQRQALGLAVCEDLSYDEIAMLLTDDRGQPVKLGTLRQWVKRALDHMRACLAQKEVGW
ncbi:MAG: RNA polymerase sigma factor [Acidimicrobiales bacterium]